MITTVTTVTTTTIVTGTEIITSGMIAVATLIILLSLREIFSSEVEKNPILESFVGTSGIICLPLMFAFITIVIIKVISLL
ncbi:MAG: hypothetical protein B6U97_04195 [Candidatus Altiarchaeales archaeon ex4484_96]|nr:MAG: hypothetical protein B6U97_04195 [Candidatus Altiarchaeales archaeon ex4484_96]